jgi:hypothetical protein
MEPRNRFRGIDFASLCSLAGQYEKYGCRTGPPGWESIPGLPKRFTNTGSVHNISIIYRREFYECTYVLERGVLFFVIRKISPAEPIFFLDLIPVIRITSKTACESDSVTKFEKESLFRASVFPLSHIAPHR